MLRDEQRLSAELSHELRTPLARIHAEVDLRGAPPATSWCRGLRAIDDAATDMQQILRPCCTSVAAAAGSLPDGLPRRRGRGHPRCPRRPTGCPDHTDVDRDLVAGVDLAVLQRLLAPVLDNAVRCAREL